MSERPPARPAFLSFARLSGLAAIAGLSFASVVGQEDSFNQTTADADRWLDLQARRAKEKSQWKSDKAMLERSISVLQSENEALGKRLESNKKADEVFTGNYTRLEGDLGEQREAMDTLEERLGIYEKEARSLLPLLPEPLAEDASKLVAKLAPESDGVPVSVAARMQSLVSFLTLVDQFNNAITLTHQIRSGGDGNDFAARVLYWGLAGGFAIDGKGDRSWIVRPGEDGWEWVEQSDRRGEISQLIDVYEKKVDPTIVLLPAAVN